MPTIFPVATYAALALIDTSKLPEGAEVTVLSNRSPWVLNKTSALTVSPTVLSTLSGTGRWIRKFVGDEKWVQQVTWFLNTSTGNDENDGLTSGTPLLTFKELKYRVGPKWVPVADVTITLSGNFANTDPIDLDLDVNLSGFASASTVIFVGTLVSVATHTLTNVTAQNTATNQSLVIAPSFPNNVLVKITSSGTPAHVGAAYWTDTFGTTLSTTSGDVVPSIGDVMTSYSLTGSRVVVRNLGVGLVTFTNVTIHDSLITKGTYTNCALLGCTFRCPSGLALDPGTAIQLDAYIVVQRCQIQGGTFNGGTTYINTSSCNSVDSVIVGNGATVVLSTDTILESSNAIVNERGHLIIHQVQVLNCSVIHNIWVHAGGVVDIIDISVSRFNPSGSHPPRVWGSGNTGTSVLGFVDGRSGGCYDTAVTGFSHITTGSDLQITGTNKTWAALPYFDSTKQAGFTPR